MQNFLANKKKKIIKLRLAFIWAKWIRSHHLTKLNPVKKEGEHFELKIQSLKLSSQIRSKANIKDPNSLKMMIMMITKKVFNKMHMF